MITKTGIIQGKEFNEYLQNLTMIGNVAVNNGIASGFDSNNYIKTLNIFPQGTYDLDIKFKVNTNSIGSTQDVLYCAGGLFIQISMNGPLLFYKSAPQWVEIMRSAVISTNTNYFVHVSQTDNIIKCYYGTNKNSLELIGQSNNLINFNNIDNFLSIGGVEGRNSPLVGTLDLREFEVSIKNKIVYAPSLITSISNYQITSNTFHEF